MKDPVKPALRIAVLDRDGGCVAVKLGADPRDCAGRLTLDHVRDASMMGRRAPSDVRHLVAICRGHHIDTIPGSGGRNWATSHREQLREYLRNVNGATA